MQQQFRRDYAVKQSESDYESLAEPLRKIDTQDAMKKLGDKFKAVFESMYDCEVEIGDVSIWTLDPQIELLRNQVSPKITDEEFERMKMDWSKRDYNIASAITISVDAWGNEPSTQLSEDLFKELGNMMEQILRELGILPKKKFYNTIHSR